jgi:LysM repeat protein
MEKTVYHRLQRGESLELLSARYRVPVCAIVRANADLGRGRYFKGMTLTIPRSCECGRVERVNRHGDLPRFRYAEYVVQPDDTLYGVALKTGLTMRILQKANALCGTAELQPGERLRIPAISGRRYYVREGEDLKSIASSHGISDQALREKNFIEAGERVGPGACLLI